MAGQNTYAWGQCTWYVAGQESWIPGGLGNAADWYANYTGPKGPTPIQGAVAVWGPGNESSQAPASADGHVAVVEGFQANGLPVVSEMNFNGGVGVRDVRNLSSTAGIIGYLYPPGTSSATAGAAASGVSAGVAAPSAPGNPADIGTTFGAAAAQGVLGLGRNVFEWASARNVALLVAAVALYLLFAPDLEGGPEARV